MYLEANLIKHTLINQLQDALDDLVLAAKVNDDTGVISNTIITVMQYLYNTYSNITNQKLAEERAIIMNHKYNHGDPISNIFTLIHNYSLMAEAHSAPESDKQLVSIGKIIITNARIYAEAVVK